MGRVTPAQPARQGAVVANVNLAQSYRDACRRIDRVPDVAACRIRALPFHSPAHEEGPASPRADAPQSTSPPAQDRHKLVGVEVSPALGSPGRSPGYVVAQPTATVAEVAEVAEVAAAVVSTVAAGQRLGWELTSPGRPVDSATSTLSAYSPLPLEKVPERGRLLLDVWDAHRERRLALCPLGPPTYPTVRAPQDPTRG